MNGKQQATVDEIVESWNGNAEAKDINGKLTVVAFPAHGGGAVHYIVDEDGGYRIEG